MRNRVIATSGLCVLLGTSMVGAAPKLMLTLQGTDSMRDYDEELGRTVCCLMRPKMLRRRDSRRATLAVSSHSGSVLSAVAAPAP